jgi:hypothetical protein
MTKLGQTSFFTFVRHADGRVSGAHPNFEVSLVALRPDDPVDHLRSGHWKLSGAERRGIWMLE